MSPAFDTPITRNVLFRTEGEGSRSWSVSFSIDDRVAYLEPEE